jgi:hypothetical protein
VCGSGKRLASGVVDQLGQGHSAERSALFVAFQREKDLF